MICAPCSTRREVRAPHQRAETGGHSASFRSRRFVRRSIPQISWGRSAARFTTKRSAPIIKFALRPVSQLTHRRAFDFCGTDTPACVPLNFASQPRDDHSSIIRHDPYGVRRCTAAFTVECITRKFNLDAALIFPRSALSANSVVNVFAVVPPAFNFQLSTVNLFPLRPTLKEKGAATAAPFSNSISLFS